MNFSPLFHSPSDFCSSSFLSSSCWFGGIAVFPIAHRPNYPEIAPPTVVVRAVYPGARTRRCSPKNRRDGPSSRKSNGVEETWLYMSSTSTSGWRD